MQHDFILLDRTGSMSTQWAEAISSVNAYVKKLADEKVDTGVTLVTFDLNAGEVSFDVIRDRITPSTWNPVSVNESFPRGMTPLNDATGRIVNLAEAGNYDKVAIIIMTDGFENASRELTVEQAKAALDRCRAKGWQVIFLGANFDNTQQGFQYGNARRSTVQVLSSNLVGAMTDTAVMRGMYGKTGAAMSYSEEDRKRFVEENRK